MTPDYFIAKWKAAALTERASAQSHFLDLCALLEEPTPAESDPTGADYAFEKGVTKTTGGDGWADVWKRGCFAWEYKGKGKDLQAAYGQLQRYAVALENPPLLVVSDIETIEIHTNWTNTVRQIHRITLDDLADPRLWTKLKWAFTDPERLKPGETRQTLTEKAATNFAALALRLRARGYEAERVAHFINRLVFCMFAEDVRLLPDQMFTEMIQQGVKNPPLFESMARMLFGAMRQGGLVGFKSVAWFNGGLFDDDDALPLDKADLEQVLAAARLDWAEIDPSILGTLFERGLDPDKRSQLGAHYTDRDKIMLIVDPVIVRPLAAEWAAVKAEAQALLDRADAAKTPAARTKAKKEAEAVCLRYRERLRAFRVLDPACGSGNFLYLSLLALKDLDHRAILDCEAMGMGRQFPQVGPEALLGIELNPYAAELARVSVWIGEIQWMLRHNYGASTSPVLRTLNTIECRDALLNPDGSEAAWPKADVIVGNPPFLGGKKTLTELGRDYIDILRKAYAGRVPNGADLVCYWFEKARSAMKMGSVTRAGLVATNSIRGGASNRAVLDAIVGEATIYDAWSDEPWAQDGAAVRVCLVCFQREDASAKSLNAVPVQAIHADLTAEGVNLTKARKLKFNRNVAFIGIQPTGPFDVDGEIARLWLQAPGNPAGGRNSDVLRPYWNGLDITRRSRERWIVDFGDRTEREASLYAEPYAHLATVLKPVRLENSIESLRTYWWRFWCPRPEMRSRIDSLPRYMVTARVAKHRMFCWMQTPVLPDSQVVVIARADDTTFGILHSRCHELWSLALCTWLGVGNDPRYTPSTTFETFPFPPGLEPDVPASSYEADPRAIAIAGAAARLVEARDRWLNPPELVDLVPEVVPGYPDRIVPRDPRAAAILKTRTLTNLYNMRGKPEGAWLDHLHQDLDTAVAAAYNWPDDLPDEQVLERLLAMNLVIDVSL